MRFFTNILVFILLSSTYALGKGVAAGTPIVNVAQLTYKVGEADFNTTSNTLTDIVDQVLELAMVCQNSDPVIVQSSENDRALTFKLANIGNGTDNFSLTPDVNTTADFQVENPRFYIDSDNNGVFDISKDTQISDINLTADSNVTLFFVSDMPKTSNTASPKKEKTGSSVPTGALSANGIEARSTISGSGTPGTSVDMGSYFAVDGIRGGVDSALCVYEMSNTSLVLQKSAALSSDKVYKGSTIHYRIKAKVDGAGELQNVIIKDTIPQGTSYVANSLKLDDVSLSDSGNITGRELAVPIGTMDQSSAHSLEFDVTVD